MSARVHVPERRLIAVLRAAAGADVGLGHLVRAIAVAGGLRARGVEPVVLMTDNGVTDAELGPIRRGIPVERLDPGRTLEDDGRATAAVLRRLNASLAITDICTQRALAHPGRLDEYHRGLKAVVPFLAVFAAGWHLDPAADLVVNPYLVDDTRQAPASDARVLWGPRYFIFRPEFVHAATVARVIPDRAQRVVIAVGGSDPARLTPRIVDRLATVRQALDVRVVVGPGVPAAERRAIAGRVDALAGWEVVAQPVDMASLFLWADLAITGDGLTKYETAVTGTPSIIVARPDSDARINAAFAAGGSTLCVEPGADAAWTALAPAIGRLIESPEARAEMSRRGRELTDGRGLERVLARIPGVCF